MLASEIQEIINRIISTSAKTYRPFAKCETEKEFWLYWSGYGEGIEDALKAVTEYAEENISDIENDVEVKKREITCDAYKRALKNTRKDVENILKK
jgi:hypothetical protein